MLHTLDTFLQFLFAAAKTHAYIWIAGIAEYATGCDEYIRMVKHFITQGKAIFITRRISPKRTCLPAFHHTHT